MSKRKFEYFSFTNQFNMNTTGKNSSKNTAELKTTILPPKQKMAQPKLRHEKRIAPIAATQFFTSKQGMQK